MTSMKPPTIRVRRDAAPLYQQARRQLLAMIESGMFPPGTQLPREQDLARSLGISRPTIREALALLQIEGIVTRRHGSGNFVNRVPPAIAARVDELISLPQVIADNGFAPELAGVRIESIEASEAVARALGLEPPAKVFLAQRLFLASGQPAVWVNDFIPSGVVGNPDLWRQFSGDMIEFLRQVCRTPIAYAVATLEVVDADDTHSAHLRVAPGAGILRITQTAYTAENLAVSYSTGDHRPGVITYSLIRRARP